LKFAKILLSAMTMTVACSAGFAANPEWEQATRMYNSGDYKGALVAFRKIAEKMPSDPSVHYMLAQCYKNSGNTKQAILELEWISKSSNDVRVKGAATALLAQIRPTAPAGLGATIPGAIDPYGSLRGASSSANTGSASKSATATTAAKRPDPPPGKTFINDSAASTISAAAQLGWMPCRASGCLNFGTPGWHHGNFEGFAPTDMFMSYPEEGGAHNYSQRHIGDVIKDTKDIGPCQACGGSGWIRSR
jgi:hypothetical protein